ncbi:lytic transglycosylase [Salmonella enterica]|nr:lytic transglycosylase [Salmonella enterica]EEK4519667.1 transglycosylase SLT domain-containing protein [Salmonella enterica]EIP9519729.1 lytic transglycosylase domain-containing protein [Salmonella enterica]
MKLYFVTFLCFFIKDAVAVDCFDTAGQYYNIEPDLLRAIAWQESAFDQNAIRKNNNGSVDIGVMQINSQHTRFLAAHGITLQKLKQDECANIYTGAYILYQSFKKLGKTWNAVGAYNAGFKNGDEIKRKRYQYSRKVYLYYIAIKKSRK